MLQSLIIDFEPQCHTEGDLIESLLYYDEVHLIVSMEGLEYLWRVIGIDMLEHLKEYGLKLHIATNHIGFADFPNWGEDVQFFYLQNQNTQERIIEKSIRNLCKENTFQKIDYNYWKNYYIDNSVVFEYSDMALSGLHEDVYKNDIHKKILQAQLEELGIQISMFRNKYEFRPIKNKGFVFKTNLQTGELELMAKEKNTDFVFKHGNLLLKMAKIYGLMLYSAELNSSIYTTPCQSLMISCKQRDIIEKYQKEQLSFRNFEIINSIESRGIATAINSKEKSWKEVYMLLDQAQGFKRWKKELSSDSDFVREFQKEVEKNVPWVKRAPFKFIRLLSTTLLGTLLGNGIAGSLLASAFDLYVIDKWKIGQWEPGQFVTGPLKKFTNV